MRYVVRYESGPDFDRSAAIEHFPAHRAWWAGFVAEGTLVGIGPFEDPANGALSIFTTREAAEAFVAGDPFVTEGVVSGWSITGWQDALAGEPPASEASTEPSTDDVRFDRLAPVVPVLDLDAALQRYAALGFAVHGDEGPDRYGFAERGGVSLHLTEWDEHDPLRTAAQVYVYVDDADALHAEWQASGVPGRLTDPADTPYGLREFAFVDDDGTLHRVGSPLTP